MAEFKWHIQLRNTDAIKLMGLVATAAAHLKQAGANPDPQAPRPDPAHALSMERIQNELMAARRRAINRRYGGRGG